MIYDSACLYARERRSADRYTESEFDAYRCR